MKAGRWAIMLLLALGPSWAAAHDLSVGYVSLSEAADGQVAATTKVARRGSALPRPLTLGFQPACRQTGQASIDTTPGTVMRQWRLDCPKGLEGTRLSLRGLDVIRPDAIVHLRLADGREHYLRADRYQPEVNLTVPDQAQVHLGLAGYFGLGVEHILAGPDHLLFVLGLILVIWRSGRGAHALLATVTAFTLAHSLTLGLATLGGATLPATAVEAAIALSILLLAVELATFERRQAAGRPMSPTFRQPWSVAFAFGLLHGFGFAGALAEIGLPEAARVWALLYFNLGVEAGQILFIAALVTAWYILRHMASLHRTAGFATTIIGAVAGFWLIERLSSLTGV